MDAAAVAAIERATVAGVAPLETREIDGWLVPIDSGTIGRARSAVPLSHTATPAALDAIEAAYGAVGLPPAFRIAEAPGLQAVRDALAARGYGGRQPTLMKLGDAGSLSAIHDDPADLLVRPDAAWAGVFASEGFDPADAASRVAAFSRSPAALFGAAREGGRTLAIGVVTFGHGWAGVHAMRTVKAVRGRGLASRVLAALGRAAVSRGIARVCLQVEKLNPACSLYCKAGFAPAWTYRYWTRP